MLPPMITEFPVRMARNVHKRRVAAKIWGEMKHQFIRHVLQRATDVSSSQSVRPKASDYMGPSVRGNGSFTSVESS